MLLRDSPAIHASLPGDQIAIDLDSFPITPGLTTLHHIRPLKENFCHLQDCHVTGCRTASCNELSRQPLSSKVVKDLTGPKIFPPALHLWTSCSTLLHVHSPFTTILWSYPRNPLYGRKRVDHEIQKIAWTRHLPGLMTSP